MGSNASDLDSDSMGSNASDLDSDSMGSINFSGAFRPFVLFGNLIGTFGATTFWSEVG